MLPTAGSELCRAAWNALVIEYYTICKFKIKFLITFLSSEFHTITVPLRFVLTCWYTVVRMRRGGTLAETRRALANLVEALRYKAEGHGFDSRWYHLVFYLMLLAALWHLQSTLPLTEMGTRNISWG